MKRDCFHSAFPWMTSLLKGSTEPTEPTEPICTKKIKKGRSVYLGNVQRQNQTLSLPSSSETAASKI